MPAALWRGVVREVGDDYVLVELPKLLTGKKIKAIPPESGVGAPLAVDDRVAVAFLEDRDDQAVVLRRLPS